MKKLDFWAVRHPLAARLLFIALCCGGSTALLILFEAPVVLTVAVNLLYASAGVFYPNVCLNRLMEKAIKELHDRCDPYPLLHVTEQLLPLVKGPNEQVVELNHCVALRNLGRYEEVYTRLTALTIDRYTGVPPLTKLVYYNNLSDVCFLLEKREEAVAAMEKVQLFYGDLKGKPKAAFCYATVLLQAAERYSAGDAAAGLRLAAGVQPQNWCQSVDRALLMARCHLALGERESAREGLNFAVQNGNRLAAVEQAQQLLKEWA